MVQLLARESRSRAAVKALKCAGEVTARAVRVTWAACAEACLSVHGSQGSTPDFAAAYSGEILEKIEGIFLCRKNRHKGICRKQVEVWFLMFDLVRHSYVGYFGQVGLVL